MLEIYQNTTYADHNPTWHEEDAPWKAKQITNILSKNKIRFDTLCEVGCGTGEILLNLERSFNFSHAVGYEVSPHAFQRAKAKETARTKFSLENVFDVATTPFDLMLVIDVIEHVEDYIGFMKQLRPLARYKVFHIPLDLSVQSLFRERPIMNLRKSVGHLHYFFKESALATLKDCGYKIIDHTYTAGRLELPNQAMSSRIMRLPRKAMFALNQDFTVRVLGGFSLLVLAE
ncbi:methyltransferase domain-containing protein [Methylobacterium sp. NEAU K]|uniref:methyltransferase domain-containing protein n=1 Tax=Methylobacterium sp. NEAU K TaxID=3064946 RepID=UPI002737625A|nr:methyltransferase domain-containing protein [Methylobacterium sp. NEAU K]MDP4004394.1 methyltransferase domain-containing protein [Methylobacterium sp. NEAU K]